MTRSPAPAAPPVRPPATHAPTAGELAHRAKDEARDTGYERAAIFLLLIDPAAAGEVLRQLDMHEVEELCRAIAQTGAVGPRDARRVAEEYGVRGVRSTAAGGADTARRLLTGAFDAGYAERLIGRIGCAPT